MKTILQYSAKKSATQTSEVLLRNLTRLLPAVSVLERRAFGLSRL